MITVKKVPSYIPPPSINLGRQEFREIRQISRRTSEVWFNIHAGELELAEPPNRERRAQQLETLRICVCTFLRVHNSDRAVVNRKSDIAEGRAKIRFLHDKKIRRNLIYVSVKFEELVEIGGHQIFNPDNIATIWSLVG